MKRYEYDDRIILQFDDKKRVNYNRKKYGELLEQVFEQASNQQEKIWNPYCIKGEYTELYYWYQKEQQIKTFIIDTEDLEKVKKQYWQLMGEKSPHVCSRSNGTKIWLHHFVLDTQVDPDGKIVVDHINRNALDNRKQNLRLVSYLENNWNKEKTAMTGIAQKYNKWRVTGSALLKQECLVDSLQEAFKVRQQYIEEYEQFLKNQN